MKKIFFIISLILILVPNRFVFAENDFHGVQTATGIKHIASESSNHKIFPSIVVRNDSSKLEDLKSRADLEIARRTDALNRLITKINSFKRLSTVQKSDLTSQIQTQIDGLNALKTKIDADTDIATLRADVKSIVTDYRIYVFFIQDINLISSAERLGTAIDNMTLLSGKLQTRIADAQTKGQDVSSLNTKYQDMQTQLSNAKALVDEVNSALSGLSASGYPGNKTTLSDSRTKLKQAFTDLKTAYEDAFGIIRALKQLQLLPTLTPTVTPTPSV